MNKENLITVSQYAAAVGITKQAVYKKLNTKLKEFVKEVEGKKYIDKAALSEEQAAKLNNVEQPFKQPLNNQIQPFLESQIEEKDKTIASLLRQVESLQEQNSKLTELLHNSQVLLAAEKKILIEQGTSQKKEKKGILGLFKRQDK